MSEIKQIRYYNYNDVLSYEDRFYWSNIDNITGLISSDLERYRSKIYDIKSEKIDFEFSTKVTTIVVLRSYEKNGAPIVEWVPAHDVLVKNKYNIMIDRYPNSLNKTLEDFRELSYIQDCIHYRNTYFAMKRLCPQYWKAIFDGATNKELLFHHTSEYDANILKFKDTEFGDYLIRKKNLAYKSLGWILRK